MKTLLITTDKQKAIIKFWKQTRMVHPTYGEIAKKVGCSKQTVYKIVQRHLQLKAGRTK